MLVYFAYTIDVLSICVELVRQPSAVGVVERKIWKPKFRLAKARTISKQCITFIEVQIPARIW